MKKEFRRNVKIGNHSFQVTDSAPEVYRITLVYDDGSEGTFYKGFYDEDAAERYCVVKKHETNNVVECYYNYFFTVIFNGGDEDEE